MIIRHFIYTLAAALLIGGAVASCTSADDPVPTDAGTPATVGITLKATPMSASGPLSKADPFITDVTEGKILPGELIQNWVVAFVQDDKVVKLAENQGDDYANGVWDDVVNVELQKGDYTVIALANMNKKKVTAALPVGTTLATDWKKGGLDKAKEEALFLKGKVPMSGFIKKVTVKGTVNETFAIELVRMLCKVEYAVLNKSTKKIEVNNFNLNPVYQGDICVFDYLNNKPEPGTSPTEHPVYPVTNPKEYYSQSTINSTISLDAGSEEVIRNHFYIKESEAKYHPTGHFRIGLSLTRGGSTEDVSYALAADKLEYFYRNDYVLFPIVITDYVPEFEVLDYPPIGGYPVNVTSENNEFYAHFSYSGAFDISARLRDSAGKTVVIEPFNSQAVPAQTQYVDCVSSDPAGLIPKYEPSLGVWQGNFDQGTHNGKIVLTFKFVIGELEYTRHLHLLSSAPTTN